MDYEIKEYPILFTTEMIDAILANRKWQTRRIIKARRATLMERPYYQADIWQVERHPMGKGWWATDGTWFPPHPAQDAGFLCDYGDVGAVLWVRETWNAYRYVFDHELGDHVIKWWHEYPTKKVSFEEKIEWEWQVIYKQQCPENCWRVPDRWMSSIHMPKKFTRIWLEVTGLRAEPLQDIKIKDVAAEGLRTILTGEDARQWLFQNFTKLWDKINESRASWESNPWVWVVSFRPIKDWPALREFRGQFLGKAVSYG